MPALEVWRQTAGLIFGPVVFLMVLLWSFPALSPDAHRLLAIVGLVIIFWVTEAIPIPVTALLGACLCVILGVGGEREVFAYFANPVIFLFIGSFILALAMRHHRLDQRFARFILSRKHLGNSHFGILAAVAVGCALLGMWISGTATTAMMLPVVLGLIQTLEGAGPPDEKLPDRYKSALILVVSYSALIGGIATPVGTPPNLIGLGFLENVLDRSVSFLEWILLALPISVVTLTLLLFLFRLQHKVGGAGLTGLRERLVSAQVELGSWTRGQKNTLIAFLTAVTLWIAPGIISLFTSTGSPAFAFLKSHFPLAVAALIGAFLLFILPTDWKRREFTLNWKQAVQIDWGTILLFGGGLTLGGLMFTTGLAHEFGRWVLSLTGATSLWTITLVAILTASLVSETTSNTASASMVVPVMIAISQGMGISPVPPALGATLGASFGFMLPVSTPPNAIVYSSGLIPITRMIKSGLVLDITGAATIWLGLRILCPVLGLL